VLDDHVCRGRRKTSRLQQQEEIVAREDPLDPRFRALPGRPRMSEEGFPPGFPFSKFGDFLCQDHPQDKASEPYLPWGGVLQPRSSPRRRSGRTGFYLQLRTSAYQYAYCHNPALKMRYSICIGSYANLRELVSQTIGYSYKPHEALQ